MIEGESLNHYEEKDECQEGDGCMEDRERKNYWNIIEKDNLEKPLSMAQKKGALRTECG